jgi:queuine/archaeosine tRNA-ribosyltransferase
LRTSVFKAILPFLGLNKTDMTSIEEAPPSMERQHTDTDKKYKEPKIRLLLHTIDGLFPYLTPQLLRVTFPVETVGNRLWLGLAVKDTCLVPTFSPEDVNKDKAPRGYAFTTDQIAVSVDTWMRPYTRVSVPTFDMVADAVSRQHVPSVVATDQHVMIWTSNGRHALISTQYTASAIEALVSPYTVPLYDDSDASTTNVKRLQTALQRTQKWSADFEKILNEADQCNTKPLFPFLVHPPILETSLRETLPFITQSKDALGAVLIGWNYLPVHSQKEILQKVKKQLESHSQIKKALEIGILSTDSLEQVLVAAQYGATLIGCNLPQVWAQKKLAFLIELDDIIANMESEIQDPPTKRTKRSSDTSTGVQYSIDDLDTNGCLSLLCPPDSQVQQHPWYRDKNPLLLSCTCYTCRTHSRSYIYHLVCAKEMLAEVLLFIHNLHHMLKLLQTIESENTM